MAFCAASGDDCAQVEAAIQPIILVRHAQAEHNLSDLTGGWTQDPLTELGQRQAALLAERLQTELADTPVSFYASDLTRAWQTAETVVRRTGLQPVPKPGLREFNNGLAANKTQAEAKWLTRVSFIVSPASISVLRLNEWQQRTIERLNDTAHLYAAGLAERMSLA